MEQNHQMGLVILLVTCLLLFSLSSAANDHRPGVRYGQLGNNLPSPSKSVELIKSLITGRVKLDDANPDILKALGNTNLKVSVTVPNELINSIASNQTLANEWVRTNVGRFYPQTMIRYVLVGNEVLSTKDDDNATWFNLVPAMRRIRKSIVAYKLTKIKVGTPLAMDCITTLFPPSSARFRSNVADSVIKPLLEFISQTKSFFFVNLYPYYAWASDPTNIDLDYALLQANFDSFYTDPGTGLMYTQLLEQMLDAVYIAMKDAGYPDVRIFIAETGWPNGGDVDEIGANIHNAAVYNRNVVMRLTEDPLRGTPYRLYVVLPSFISALYNENMRTGPGSERHFGLFYPNGTSIYPIDLSGKTP